MPGFARLLRLFRGERSKPPPRLIPTVRFDQSRVTRTVKDDLQNNVRLLEGVDPKYSTAIFDAALQSVMAGRHIGGLCAALLQMGCVKSKKRAAEIAQLLNNKAFALMQKERQQALGITRAKWIYAGVPCTGSVQQYGAHKAVDGKEYVVSDGMFLNGTWTWPGREDGCKCVSRSVIAGLS